MDGTNQSVALSVVIPVFNEQENIAALAVKLREALADFAAPLEILFVDDGSTDTTLEELRRAERADPRIRIVRLRKNAGQSAAMEAGFRFSRGASVVTLDGDLQNDPADILALAEKLGDYDVVCGVRVNRQDTWLKRVSSRIANGVRNWATGDDIIDTGCTLKAFRGDRVRRLKLYKGMHRFLPTLLKMQGCRVVQVPVRHHPRRAGQSKYGTMGRMFKGIEDLFAVRWMKKNWIEYEATIETCEDPKSESLSPGGPDA